MRTKTAKTFRDYAESYQKVSGKHAKTSIVNDMVSEFGAALPHRWTSRFEKFIGEQDGRTCRNSEREISTSTIKAYKRYFKAICGHAMGEYVSAGDRLTVNHGLSIKVGKPEARSGCATDEQRRKILEVIGNDYPWILPAVEFARSMPIRPEDLFATMYPIDTKDEFWKELPRHMRPLIGLTLDKINEVHKSIAYLPKKTWKTEKLATPLILPNIMGYIKGRIGDPDCQTIFCRQGNPTFKEDPGRHYPITYKVMNRVWNKVRDAAKVPNLTFLEFTRHDAVNFLRANNVPDSTIMQFAGWSTRSVLDLYDSRNTDRIVRTTYDRLAGAVQKESSPLLHQENQVV